MKNLKAYIFLCLIVACGYSLRSQVVSGGELHSMSICEEDSTVWTWGENSESALGGASLLQYVVVPAKINNLNKIIAVSAGHFFSIALRNDGTVWSWGENYYGQLGLGYATTSGCYCVPSPVQISTLNNIISIKAGIQHCIALKNDGTVWAWGSNSGGLLGDGTFINRPTPIMVPGLNNVIAITCNQAHSMALKSDGTVWAWGANHFAQLGNGNDTTYIAGQCLCRNTPQLVNGLSGVVDIEAGYDYSLALRNDSTVFSWGANAKSQLGNGSQKTTGCMCEVVPATVPGLEKIITISAGQLHSLALNNNGQVFGWGENYTAETGIGSTGSGTCHCVSSPTPILALNGVKNISAGSHFSLIKKTDNTIWGWGENNYGQIGKGYRDSTGCYCTLIPEHTNLECSIVTGLNEHLANNTFSVYPNPSNVEITISFKEVQLNGIIELLDIFGNKMRTILFDGQVVSIDKEGIEAGVYILRVYSKQGKDTTKIIIE